MLQILNFGLKFINCSTSREHMLPVLSCKCTSKVRDLRPFLISYLPLKYFGLYLTEKQIESGILEFRLGIAIVWLSYPGDII